MLGIVFLLSIVVVVVLGCRRRGALLETLGVGGDTSSWDYLRIVSRSLGWWRQQMGWP
jgi:hypothetical protein